MGVEEAWQNGFSIEINRKIGLDISRFTRQPGHSLYFIIFDQQPGSRVKVTSIDNIKEPSVFDFNKGIMVRRIISHKSGCRKIGQSLPL